MKKRFIRRILSGILVLVMVSSLIVGLTPTDAYAEDETTSEHSSHDGWTGIVPEGKNVTLETKDNGLYAVLTETPHTHEVETTINAVAATCTTAGNNKYYKCACGKYFKDADCTTETTEADETIDPQHSWEIEKNERGHWGTCSVCSSSVDSEEYPALHIDDNKDNKCDVCEYKVYHVTVNANGMTIGGAKVIDTDERRLFRISDRETFIVPENCKVEVICYREINNVVAPGAKTELVAGEGIANTGCVVSDFTRDTVIVLNADKGEIEADVTVNEEAPIQGVELKNNIDEFIESSNIFTVADIDSILTGANAKVWLEVNKMDTVPAVQKTAMEAKVTSLGANTNITYFDASLFKQIGSGQPQSVSEPGMDIEITIAIPQSLLNTDTNKTRTYTLLRYHEGEGVTEIPGTFSDGKFTFKTNKFSTYAIVYKDTVISNPDGEGSEGGSSPAEKQPEDGNTSNNDKKQENKDTSNPDNKSEDKNVSNDDKNTSKAKSTYEVPETGDNNNLMYATTLMVVSAIGICFFAKKRRFVKSK